MDVKTWGYTSGFTTILRAPGLSHLGLHCSRWAGCPRWVHHMPYILKDVVAPGARAKQSRSESRTSTEYRTLEAPSHDTTLHSDHAEIPGRWRYPDIAHLSDELWSMPRRLCTITITITIIYRPLASRTDIGLRHPSTTLLNQSRLLHTPNQLKTRAANAVSSCANSARANSAPDMLQSKRHATTLW